MRACLRKLPALKAVGFDTDLGGRRAAVLFQVHIAVWRNDQTKINNTSYQHHLTCFSNRARAHEKPERGASADQEPHLPKAICEPSMAQTMSQKCQRQLKQPKVSKNADDLNDARNTEARRNAALWQQKQESASKHAGFCKPRKPSALSGFQRKTSVPDSR